MIATEKCEGKIQTQLEREQTKAIWRVARLCGSANSTQIDEILQQLLAIEMSPANNKFELRLVLEDVQVATAIWSW